MARTNFVLLLVFRKLCLLLPIIASVLTTVRGHVLEFVVEPSDTVVQAGHSAVLDCVAKSADFPPNTLNIQWLDRDRQTLTFIGDSYRSQLLNGSLYISSVAEELGLTGSYQCMASLPNGAVSIVSRSATLSLANLSGFIQEPRDVTIYPSQKAYFACRVNASPPPRIRWLKDERPLLLDDLRMTVLPSGALEIDEVSDSDQGSYRCNASGLNSYRLSNKASLVINGDEEQAASISPPSFIASPLGKIVAIEGQTVTLDCAANGNPQPIISWLKDGKTIDMADLDSRFSLVESTNTLRISKISEDDAGTYQCRASNKDDSLDATSRIEVQVPPKFIKKPTDKAELVNKDVELECVVKGKPEPKVQWFKNGELITPNREYYQLINGYNLKIMGLIATDTALFQCVASNAAGNVQAAAFLKVIDTVARTNPKNKRKKKPVDKIYSLTSFEQLKTEKTPKQSALSKLGLNANQGISAHAIFESLKTSDNNENNLRDVNFAYTPSSTTSDPTADDPTYAMKSDILPGPPQDLKAPVVKARFVILSWNPPDVNSVDIIAYSVYYRQEGSKRERVQNTTRSKLEEINIGGLQPDKVYHFRVLAFNNFGPGVTSDSLTVTTQSEEHVPSSPLQFVAYPTSSRSIHVSWKAPEDPKGADRYKVYYMETSSSTEHNIETKGLEYNIVSLSVYTEYNVWVVAINQVGPGAATEEITVRTFTAEPTEPPYNITLEPASSTSIIVRWEPPPIEGQNGPITGYKLRFRKHGKKGDTITTPANQHIFILDDLERGSMYQVRLWALNVNGTGPPSDWYEITTYENDLDETSVPDVPSQLRVRATSDKIYVMWNPPLNQNIKIRYYVVGWGMGYPDAVTRDVDDKQRNFIIENLESNREYVISVRARNEVGDGQQVLTNVRTRDEPLPEQAAPLYPPVGLKAQVLSATSVVLYWTDTTLGKSQIVLDNRYYVVQYKSDKGNRNKFLNITVLNVMIDDLKPNTNYEFSVKLVKGQRESPWSMVVHNKTWEVPPNSAPRELNVRSVEEDSQIIELTWQPPKQQNAHVTGYVILYTTDMKRKDREWWVKAVKGDKHLLIINDLKTSTKYYFKIQARNERGYGPFSPVTAFVTGQNFATVYSDVTTNTDTAGIFSNPPVLYTVIGGSAVLMTTAIGVLVFFVCCRRKETTSTSPDRSKKGYQKGNQSIKPPDLWIHHDQMELKNLEKNQAGNDGASSSGAMTLPRSVGANDYDSHDPHHSNSLDKRSYIPSYMGNTPIDDKNKRVMKPKPITLPVDSKPPREPIATATPINTTLSQTSSESTPSSRPPYPRTQYTISRAHVTLDHNSLQPNESSPYAHSNYDTAGHNGPSSNYINPQPPVAHVPPSSTYAPGMNIMNDAQQQQQMGKRVQAQGHPLKSFTVPAPPPISAPGTPQPKHIVTPQPQITVRANSSPYKKATSSGSSTLTSTPPSRISASNPPPHTAEEVQRLQPSHSTEELNQEMANLEGLMMTLNAITASEFEC